MSAVIDRASLHTFSSRNFTEDAGLGKGPISVEPYRSPAFFELERERVFKRAWLCMGRVEQLPELNTYFVKEVEVAKASVLVTKAKDGKIRAFHNVCSHRGNLVVNQACGKADRFVCRYHNWMYRDDGDLMGVPDQKHFFDLDKKTCGLTPIALDTWEGWIFINFQKKPEVSLLEFLGPYGKTFANVPVFNLAESIVIEAKFKANWKLIADAFAEAYHVSSLHPETLAPGYSHPERNKYSRPLSGLVHGLHRSFSTYGNPEYAPSPDAKVERLVSVNDTGNILGGDATEAVKALTSHPAINPEKGVSWAADVTWIFPNFNIDYSTGGFWTHEFWPLAYDQTRWTLRIFIPKAASIRHRLQLEHLANRWSEVVLEDLSNCERIQKGLESGAKDVMILQDGEFMIRHALETLNKWVNAETVKDAMR